MQAERWKRVEELFEAARQQPPDGRAEFLRQASPGDPELCAEVESLLKAAETPDPLLDGSPLSSIAERPSALKPGDTLGSFEILGLIGRGGMGEVYRARDPRLKRAVAIKTLPPAFAADRDRVARFEREARAASALNHPNIVSVYDIGHQGDVWFIVSELVEGETLARALERGPLPLRKLIETGTQIADGLAAAHAAGVVHRDLKPGNIMLTRDGRVKVLDFGLARRDRIPGADSTTLEVSHPGVILGTPGYMAPEQVRGEATDARSDLFSLGVILYEMASGRRAFNGGSSIEVMNSILKDDPPELPPTSPPALDRIIRRCIDKQPSRRFHSAADLGFALGSIAGTTQGLTPAAPSRELHRPFRVAAATVLCAVVAGSYWLGHYWSVGDRVTVTSADAATLRQLTWDHGFTGDPAISPDGKLVAFASDRAGSNNLDIWVQQIDGGEPVRLTSDPADEHDPTFSADGTRIAFRSEREGGGIYMIPALGGELTRLVPEGLRPRFSPDGRSLMYFAGRDDALMVTSLSEGAPADIAPGCKPSGAAWSPDSKHILMLARCTVSTHPGAVEVSDDVWLVDPARKVRRKTRWKEYLDENLIDLHYNFTWLDKPPRLLAIANARAAPFLVSVPVSPDGMDGAGPPRKLTFGTGSETQASTAGNGRIAVASTLRESHVWGVPIDDAGRSTGPARQLTVKRLLPPSGSVAGCNPFAFLDKSGTQVTYCGGAPEIQDVPILPERQNVSVFSVPFEEVSQRFLPSAPSDWSHDGKVLLMPCGLHRGPLEGAGDICARDNATRIFTPLIGESGRRTYQAHFSPDDRWIAFNAVENGSDRIFVAPFRHERIPAAEWHAITNESTWTDKPRFSLDGKILFFTSRRDGFTCIWAQRLTPDMRPTGEPFAVYHSHQMRLLIGNANDGWGEVSVGRSLIVFVQAGLSGNIWLLDQSAKVGEN